MTEEQRVRFENVKETYKKEKLYNEIIEKFLNVWEAAANCYVAGILSITKIRLRYLSDSASDVKCQVYYFNVNETISFSTYTEEGKKLDKCTRELCKVDISIAKSAMEANSKALANLGFHVLSSEFENDIEMSISNRN